MTDPNFWATVVGMGAALIGTVIVATLWLNKRLSERVTRQEHQDSCRQTDGRIDSLKHDIDSKFKELKDDTGKSLAEIKATLEKQDDIARETRHAQNGTLQTVLTDIGVLKAVLLPRPRERE